jgi:hypothetical protein
MNLVAWGLLGFDQIARYQDLVVALAKNQETRGYSLVALMSDYGIGRQWAHGVMLGVAVLIAGVCLAVGRRGGGRPTFALCVATCLVATPISWLHYFALLVIPLALARPRLSALWLVPLLFQFPTVGPSAQQTAITFALAAAITAVAMMSAARDPKPRETVVAVPLSTPSEAFSAP